jgi:hypothetical protein
VKTELGTVESVKVTRNGLMIIVCVYVGQREKAVGVKRMRARHLNYFAVKKRGLLKGVITGVAVNIKVDQLKGKMLVIWCDTDRVVK